MDMELTGSANCLASGVQVGEYRLLGVVGEGGFGIVYRARDLSLDRIVAIKEYMPATLAGRMASNQIHVRSQHKGAFDAGLRSFINEARLLAKFSHPALVHVYRFFEENGTAYMVMRYYEGQTFRAFLSEQDNGMNERWLSAMLSPILDVLEMLHTADCFHRDIAPDNVFLQASGMPVLLDFGAARRIIGDMTQALTMVLKPGFAPIEQYADDGGMPQGAWTDIYQLGAMLYLAITGKVPTTSVARMISDPIRMLTSAEYPGYSDQFLQGVHRALAVKPSDRPQSIAELKSLLGIRTFTAPALSAWSASTAMPLDMLSSDTGPLPAPSAGGAPQQPTPLPRESTSATSAVDRVQDDLEALQKQRSVVHGVAAVDLPLHGESAPPDEVTFAPNSADPARKPPEVWVAPPVVTVPLHAPSPPPLKAPPGGAPGADRRRPSPETQSTDAPTNHAGQSAVAPQKSRAKQSAILIGLMLVVLAGAWLFSGGNSQPERDSVSVTVSDRETWEAAKKEQTVTSLQGYLDAFPAGDHVLEARSMLATLTQASAAAVRTTEVIESLTKENAAAELAAEAKASAATAKPQVSVPPIAPGAAGVAPSTTKPTPAATVAGAAPVNAAVGTARPPTEPGKADPPAIVLSEPKRAAPVEMGKVTLRVTPWGNVRVNRASVGTTPPLNQLDLPEGQHQIEISNPAGPSVTKVVQVKKGEPVVLSHKFE
jgi:serine/threonine protein kinase